MVGIDILGPFPHAETGTKYVLITMDYFSKWPEAYSLPNQEAETVVKELLSGMFSRFGTLGVIHSESHVFVVV